MSSNYSINLFKLKQCFLFLCLCFLLFVLQVFNMTSMQLLRRKSLLLTGYLEYLIGHYYNEDPAQACKPHVRIITPSDPQQRGCQLSLCFSVPVQRIFQQLEKRGVVVSSLESPSYYTTRHTCKRRKSEIKTAHLTKLRIETSV